MLFGSSYVICCFPSYSESDSIFIIDKRRVFNSCFISLFGNSTICLIAFILVLSASLRSVVSIITAPSTTNAMEIKSENGYIYVTIKLHFSQFIYILIIARLIPSNIG